MALQNSVMINANYHINSVYSDNYGYKMYDFGSGDRYDYFNRTIPELEVFVGMKSGKVDFWKITEAEATKISSISCSVSVNSIPLIDSNFNLWFMNSFSLYKIPFDSGSSTWSQATLVQDFGKNFWGFNSEYANMSRITEHNGKLWIEKSAYGKNTSSEDLAYVTLVSYDISSGATTKHSYFKDLFGMDNDSLEVAGNNLQDNYFNISQSAVFNNKLISLVYTQIGNGSYSKGSAKGEAVVFDFNKEKYVRFVEFEKIYDDMKEESVTTQGLVNDNTYNSIHTYDNHLIFQGDYGFALFDEDFRLVRASSYPMKLYESKREFDEITGETRLFSKDGGGNRIIDIFGKEVTSFTNTTTDKTYTSGNIRIPSDKKSVVKAPQLISDTELYTSTPEMIFKVQESDSNVTQSFILSIGASDFNSKNGGWSYSIDSGSTWTPFTGEGKLTDGVHGTNGVLCDSENNSNMLVKVQVSGLEDGLNQEYTIKSVSKR
jgi:hypothetical protein